MFERLDRSSLMSESYATLTNLGKVRVRGFRLSLTFSSDVKFGTALKPMSC